MARKLTIIALVALSAVFSLLAARSLFASGVQTAVPKPGSLDATFGAGGRVITDFENGSDDEGFAVAVQRDGRILVAGEALSSTLSTALVRYTANGALDPTFDGDGKVRLAFQRRVRAELVPRRLAVALQPDQKIVVAGTSWSGHGTNFDFGLMRFNVDGSLDTSFAGNGTVVTDFDSNYDFPVGLAILSDGKIVLAGVTGTSVSRPMDVALARYNSDGTLDGSFDGDGKVVSDVTGGGDDDVLSVAVRADGRILVGGSSVRGSDRSGFLLRYLLNGGLDPTFDGDGRVVLQQPPMEIITDVTLQPNGKIIATTWGGPIVVQFNSNGSVDENFGSGGVAVAHFSRSALAFAVTIQPNGKIVVGGFLLSDSSDDSDFALGRFLPSGDPDASFGSGGVVETKLQGVDAAWDVGIAPTGKIVLVGGSWPISSGPGDFAVARYLGEPQCRVPNVRGKKLPVAKSAISKAYCGLGKVKRKASKKVKRNRVISQSPQPGRTLPSLGKVNLVVSRGRG